MLDVESGGSRDGQLAEKSHALCWTDEEAREVEWMDTGYLTFRERHVAELPSTRSRQVSGTGKLLCHQL